MVVGDASVQGRCFRWAGGMCCSRAYLAQLVYYASAFWVHWVVLRGPTYNWLKTWSAAAASFHVAPVVAPFHMVSEANRFL